MTSPFRPSGPMNWLLGKLASIPTWSLVGTVSPEDRSLAVLSELKGAGRLENAEFIRVEPATHHTPNRFRKGFTRKLNAGQKEAKQIAGALINVRPQEILCREEELVSICRESLHSCSENLIIDISAMPKRFFFPLVTLAIESGEHENIVVTYASPDRYGNTLAEDPLPWNAFPMFGATPPSREDGLKLLIAVGYQSLRLHQLVDGVRFNASNVELLLPFPSVHPGFIKNWEFVRQIRLELPELRGTSIKRVPTMNASLAFDRVVAITNNGGTPSVLAPYGPKPVSLAMCLYGVACRNRNIQVEIGYTQPQVYSDKYSIGVAMDNGKRSVTAYCIRLSGRNLFDL